MSFCCKYVPDMFQVRSKYAPHVLNIFQIRSNHIAYVPNTCRIVLYTWIRIVVSFRIVYFADRFLSLCIISFCVGIPIVSYRLVSFRVVVVSFRLDPMTGVTEMHDSNFAEY